jgi:hypothetical protein
LSVRSGVYKGQDGRGLFERLGQFEENTNVSHFPVDRDGSSMSASMSPVWSVGAKVSRKHSRQKYALFRAKLCAGQCGGRQHLAAIKWYEQAIAWSAQEQLPVDEGLANSCLGHYFCEMGCQQQLAIPFLLKAKDAYQRWGAVTLVAHMDTFIEQIYSSESAPPPNPSSTTPARSVVGTRG